MDTLAEREVATLSLGESRRVSLAALLEASDFVSLHCPGGATTRHLLDATQLALMPAHAFLINTARGEVVDETALIAALREGRLKGAALDVYPAEPAVPPALMQLENVVLLPHLGSATRETRTAMCNLAARNLIEVIEGRPPVTPIPGSYLA